MFQKNLQPDGKASVTFLKLNEEITFEPSDLLSRLADDLTNTSKNMQDEIDKILE